MILLKIMILFCLIFLSIALNMLLKIFLQNSADSWYFAKLIGSLSEAE
jgi:hypothetical protein